MDRRSSGDQVASHIRRMIFDGELRRGDRVRQDEIAAQLGVSRIPVREAIIALDREGWVVTEPHRGAFVLGFDEAYVRDHYEVYGLVFGLAARRATERATSERLAALTAGARAVAAADGPGAFASANTAFLNALIEVSGSPRLTSLLRVMTGIVPGNFFAEIPGAIDIQRKGVALIVRRIKAGDPDKAADACLALLRRQGLAVQQELEARGLFVDARPSDAVAGGR